MHLAQWTPASAGERRHSGRREALFCAIAPDISLRCELGKKGNAKEINAIVASMLRLGIRDFSASFDSAQAVVSGSHRELWALRKTARLSQEQIANDAADLRRMGECVSLFGPLSGIHI